MFGPDVDVVAAFEELTPGFENNEVSLDGEDFSVHDSSSDNLINSDDDFAPKPSNSTKIPCAEKNTNIADSTPDKDNANRSFKDMGFLVTPEIKLSATKRKPALNSRAQEVTKALFSGSSKKALKKENTKLLGKQVQKSKNHKENEVSTKVKSSESWFCFVCNENRQVDMRLCSLCKRYVHEECVGLTKADKDIFMCPHCV
ncbi:hypothetical protein FQA39_LY06974 [Lamprigera yunnana]|nr:hypothetical protein FQA39_LY06974 [Lamprigera yunnana]